MACEPRFGYLWSLKHLIPGVPLKAHVVGLESDQEPSPQVGVLPSWRSARVQGRTSVLEAERRVRDGRGCVFVLDENRETLWLAGRGAG